MNACYDPIIKAVAENLTPLIMAVGMVSIFFIWLGAEVLLGFFAIRALKSLENSHEKTASEPRRQSPEKQ